MGRILNYIDLKALLYDRGEDYVSDFLSERLDGCELRDLVFDLYYRLELIYGHCKP